MNHPIPGGNFTGGKNLEALSLGGELPQNVQSFLEAVPTIDIEMLQTLLKQD